jgi:hypothetical protein
MMWLVCGLLLVLLGVLAPILVVMIKDKAYNNNPHSEDNVEKKMHSRYRSSLSPATGE